ncbi:hypothetical protein TSOC_002165 [Tetrabaena socialis]|uniref:RING-type domain-containing protein n=1 Tax=Tetrabaena socialis TaxID=47790 RepID=A0A2J8AES5_9CHLO|nr:hypothetical protein TSOC_002165 [Tetrabaena socialis]|eukprot:PNH11023.1 hypothetical protein TSOC_002165 [Tetrabaena socialis]
MCRVASRIAARIILVMAIPYAAYFYQLRTVHELRPINGYANQNQALFWIGDRPSNREFLEARTREAGSGVLTRHEDPAAPPRSLRLEWAVSPVMPLRRPVSSKTFVAGGVMWCLSLGALADFGLPRLAGAVLTHDYLHRHRLSGPVPNGSHEHTFDAERSTMLVSTMLFKAAADGPWRLRFKLEIHGGMAAWEENSTHLEAQYGRALGEQLLVAGVLSDLNLGSELQPEASFSGRPPASTALQPYVAGLTGGSSRKGGGGDIRGTPGGASSTQVRRTRCSRFCSSTASCVNGVNRDRAEEVMHELLHVYRLRNFREAKPPFSGGVYLMENVNGEEEDVDRYGQPIFSYLKECQRSAQAPPLYLPPPGRTTLCRLRGRGRRLTDFEEPWGLRAKAARAKGSEVSNGGRASASANGRNGGDGSGGGGEQAVRTIYLSPLRRAPLDPNQALYAGNLLWLILSRAQWLTGKVPLPGSLATSSHEVLVAVGGPSVADRWEASGAAHILRWHGGMGLPLALLAVFSSDEYAARLMADVLSGWDVGRDGNRGDVKLMNWQGQFVPWHGGDVPPGTAEVSAAADKHADRVLIMCGVALVVYCKQLPVRALLACVGRAWKWGRLQVQGARPGLGRLPERLWGATRAAVEQALQALLLLAQLPAWSRERLLAACAAAWMQVRRNLARFGTWLAGLAADDQRQQQPQQQQHHQQPQQQQPQGQQQQQRWGGAGGGGAVEVAGVGGAAAAGDDDAELCLICMDAPRRHGLLHSGTVHVCVCDKCADDMRKQLTQQQQQGARRRQALQRLQQQQLLACPLCRALVEDVVKVY